MFKFLTIFLLFGLNNSVLAEGSVLLIEDAWIAEAPPTSKVMVAYMTIKNPTAEKINIISATSRLYSSIEFHETVHQDGMARMLRHPSLSIPANGRILLKRGGKHLMLFNPTTRLRTGDSVSITFTTENDKKLIKQIIVKKAQY